MDNMSEQEPVAAFPPAIIILAFLDLYRLDEVLLLKVNPNPQLESTYRHS